jgi:UDP-3-O-[3-hydroxymyristoyl] glucosamine N-acyltransferase
MLSLPQIAEAVGAEIAGPDRGRILISRVANAATADAHSLVFAESIAALQQALESAAAVVLTTPTLGRTADNPAKPLLLVSQPRLAFARIAQKLRPPASNPGIHPTAVVAATAQIASGVFVGPYAVIGEHAAVGERTSIGAGCVLAERVRIGDDCDLFPNVVVYAGTALGNRVIVHAGCVLGSDGFGYVRDTETGEYTQFPQQGTLCIEDDVEIGANTTIDRGAFEETRIEWGTKLDNLVHIGHNVRIGRNVVIAAQTGISGSSVVGHGAVLGGQVGIGEHADVGANVILGGGAGVLSKKKLRGAGMVFWGRPAQPLREYLKGLASLARLSRKAKE